jgi:hypothetical protein
MIALDHFNAKVFAEHLNTKFQTKMDDGTPVVLQLFDVEEPDPSSKVELFFVRFRGPVVPRLPQLIYPLQHGVLGSLELFLTATGATQAGCEYEAVFHRFRKPA